MVNKLFVNEYSVHMVKLIQLLNLYKRQFNIKLNSTTRKKYTVADGFMTNDMPVGTNGIQTAVYADDTCV